MVTNSTKRQKTNSLNNNIKCGNSLIDDIEVAGDKAFNWQNEFPRIFKEKDKKIYHITTAIHDSRTSARMKKYKVRERREGGTNPYPNIIYFTKEDDLLITQTIAEIVKEDNVNMLAYNICADHIHLLLACDIDEVPRIMQKIKSITSKVVNRLHNTRDNTREYAPLRNKEDDAPLQNKPLWQQKYSAPKEVTSQEQLQNTINYIQNNRSKHELLEHSSKLNTIIGNMCCDFETAMQPEYNGGFDVVIGNPPYVRVQNLDKSSVSFFEQHYKSATGKFDIYVLFNELSVKILKESGLMSFIQPHRFINADFGKGLRSFFESTQYLNKIISFSDIDIFEGATTYTGIFFLEKKLTDSVLYKEYTDKKPIHISENLDFLTDDDFINVSYSSIKNNWEFKSEDELNLLKKLRDFEKLSAISLNISQGVIPGSDKIYYLEVLEEKNDKFLVKNQLEEGTFLIEKKITRNIIKGNNIKRYASPTSDYVIIYPYQLLDKEQKLYSIEELNQHYPLALDYLSKHKEFLINLRKKYKTNPLEWYGFHRAREMRFLEVDKIITSHTSISPSFTFATGLNYFNQNVYGIEIKKEVSLIQVLGILNSKLSDFYIRNTSSMINGGYYLYKTDYISNLPVITIENTNIISLTNKALEINSALSNHNNKLLKYLAQSYQIERFSKKLGAWYELDFGEFIKELNKAIKKNGGGKLSKSDEIEWVEIFEVKKNEASNLLTQINKTDREIDKMVYELYGLTEDEIAIVEEATS